MPENAVQIIFDPHVSAAIVCLAAALLIMLGLWARNLGDKGARR